MTLAALLNLRQASISRYDHLMHRFVLLVALLCLTLCLNAAPKTKPSTQPTTRAPATAEDGSILLHSKDVTIHGTTVRYEPNPKKNTIGFWTKKEDWVSWDFEVKKPG